MIPKILNTMDFWEHYLSYFYAIFVVQTCQGTPWIITKLLPNQIKPLEALFWVVFAHLLTKLPKRNWFDLGSHIPWCGTLSQVWKYLSCLLFWPIKKASFWFNRHVSTYCLSIDIQQHNTISVCVFVCLSNLCITLFIKLF